jgi:hypothetical protein
VQVKGKIHQKGGLKGLTVLSIAELAG